MSRLFSENKYSVPYLKFGFPLKYPYPLKKSFKILKPPLKLGVWEEQKS